MPKTKSARRETLTESKFHFQLPSLRRKRLVLKFPIKYLQTMRILIPSEIEWICCWIPNKVFNELVRTLIISHFINIFTEVSLRFQHHQYDRMTRDQLFLKLQM